MTPNRQPRRPELAGDLIRRNAALKGERSDIDNLNQDIANYVMPRKNQITTTETRGSNSPEDALFDLTAVRDAQVLASGQLDYLVSGKWFMFEPPMEIELNGPVDDARQWCQKCSEIVLKELLRSNFRTEIHEMFLDRSTFTHANLMCDEGKKALYNFRNDDVGTYSIAEDDEGNVDTIFREFTMTARQAVMKFGRENVGPCIGASYDDANKCDVEKHQFIHCVYPRKEGEYDDKKLDAQFFRIASVYVAVKDKIVCRESGYPEMPYVVTRFLKWGDSPYGYTPSIEALPAVRQVNLMVKHMAALGEIKAWPRVLLPAGMEGQVDLSPGGQTLFDPNTPADSLPREWGTDGEWNIGERLIEMVQEQIHKAYFVDLFQMLANLPDKQRTAYEVAQRLAEKVSSFSPTFDRLDQEVFKPILARCFAMAYRAKRFPEPPQSMLIPNPDGKTARIAIPEVTLTGKMALAIKEVESNAFVRAMEILMPMAQLKPDVWDNVNTDEGTRMLLRNGGVPANVIMDVEERDEMRAQRAQQQQAAMELEGAGMAAKAAKDMNGASPEMQKAAMQAMGG